MADQKSLFMSQLFLSHYTFTTQRFNPHGIQLKTLSKKRKHFDIATKKCIHTYQGNQLVFIVQS